VTAVTVLQPQSAVRADEEVIYLDRASRKEVHVVGPIQSEGPGSVVIRPNTGAKIETIPAGGVIDVIYDVPFLVKQDYRAALNREAAALRAATLADRQKEIVAALGKYRDLQPKVTEARARRHMEFKIAQLLALASEMDREQEPTARESLERYRKEHSDTWEVIECSDLLGNLLAARDDWAGARQVYETLAATTGVSADTHEQCDVHIIELLIRAKKPEEAEKRLEALAAALAPDSPQGLRLAIEKVACHAALGRGDEAVRQLEALIARAADADVKALAYNVLGDCHRLTGKPREALWDYLWVDVIYHDDRMQHARALYQLVHLFAELKDDTRARQYRERLVNDHHFAGLESRRRIMAEYR
jgi:hypothetical protein